MLFDGVITQLAVDLCLKRNVKYLVGARVSILKVKIPKRLQIITIRQIEKMALGENKFFLDDCRGKIY